MELVLYLLIGVSLSAPIGVLVSLCFSFSEVTKILLEFGPGSVVVFICAIAPEVVAVVVIFRYSVATKTLHRGSHPTRCL